MSDDEFADGGDYDDVGNDDYDADNFNDDGGDFGEAEDGDDPEGGEETDPKVAIENQYYLSKDLEEEQGVDEAIKGFSKVLDMEKKWKDIQLNGRTRH